MQKKAKTDCEDKRLDRRKKCRRDRERDGEDKKPHKGRSAKGTGRETEKTGD